MTGSPYDSGRSGALSAREALALCPSAIAQLLANDLHVVGGLESEFDPPSVQPDDLDVDVARDHDFLVQLTRQY
jgi:hypothetical protein